MELDDAIRRAVESIPGISILVVFGSRARGTHRPDSDLDVAVLPDGAHGGSRWHLQADVAVALADLSSPPEGRVDVVFLDEAPVALRQSIMEHGRVLINRNPEAWKELRVRTMREYGDSEWARQLYWEAQKRRLERREPSGRSPKAFKSLAASGSYLTELRSLRNVSREEFLRDGKIHHLAERFLHLASECVLDVAQHVIADEGYRQAPTNKATMDVLQEEGVLDPELAKRMKSWMGFRNVLVHLYADIDHGESYDAIQNDLGDLEEFAAAMSRFL